MGKDDTEKLVLVEDRDLYTRKTKKVTKSESLLYTNEWRKKAIEEGHSEYTHAPRRIFSVRHSIGELIAYRYACEDMKSRMKAEGEEPTLQYNMHQ